MIILIENLTFEAILGVLDIERQKPQKLVFDAKIKYDYQDDYLNYVEIINLVINEIQQNQYYLLEEALEDLNLKLKKTFSSITTLTLSLKKPQIIPDVVVGVQIIR